MEFDYSILIPTWNNIELLKVCVKSIRKHSVYNFQILVYVNEGNDNTHQWLEKEGITFVKSNQNVGICIAMNALRPLVKSKVICYLNDDMYVLPDWDKYVIDEIKPLTKPYFISSSMIEPRSESSSTSIKADYGKDPSDFHELNLLGEFLNYPLKDWNGSAWPPLWLSVELWDQIDGFSEEFSPGMYSDPDMAMKAWQAGVRYFRGISDSRVYHFGSKSTSKLKSGPNIGRKRFLNKWGITARYFYKYYLRMGTPFTGKLSEPRHPFLGLLVNKWKKKRISISELTEK